jgi:hypothetical protein
MAHIGFWQLLLDDKVSYWEAQKINETHAHADAAFTAAVEIGDRVGEAARRINQLSREVIMLRAAVTVLVNTLRDTKVLDPQLLDARLDAAIEDALRPPEPARPAAGSRPWVVCLRCRQTVQAQTTTMTAEGPMCDRCPEPG